MKELGRVMIMDIYNLAQVRICAVIYDGLKIDWNNMSQTCIFSVNIPTAVLLILQFLKWVLALVYSYCQYEQLNYGEDVMSMLFESKHHVASNIYIFSEPPAAVFLTVAISKMSYDILIRISDDIHFAMSYTLHHRPTIIINVMLINFKFRVWSRWSMYRKVKVEKVSYVSCDSIAK